MDIFILKLRMFRQNKKPDIKVSGLLILYHLYDPIRLVENLDLLKPLYKSPIFYFFNFHSFLPPKLISLFVCSIAYFLYLSFSSVLSERVIKIPNSLHLMLRGPLISG